MEIEFFIVKKSLTTKKNIIKLAIKVSADDAFFCFWIIWLPYIGQEYQTVVCKCKSAQNNNISRLFILLTGFRIDVDDRFCFTAIVDHTACVGISSQFKVTRFFCCRNNCNNGIRFSSEITAIVGTKSTILTLINHLTIRVFITLCDITGWNLERMVAQIFSRILKQT